jgi:hypothetical protein
MTPMAIRSLRCLLLAMLVAGTSALQVVAALGRNRSPAAASTSLRGSMGLRMAEPVAEAEAAAAEGENASDGDDAPEVKRGVFIEYYRREREIAKWKKENPQSTLDFVWSRIDGPLKTLAVIGSGYYLFPLIDGVKKGMATGEMGDAIVEAISRG